MPGYYGQRPEDVLTQIQQTPITDPSQGEAAAAYEDQPAKEAIAHYVTTGQMPTTMRRNPSGTISSILQGIGLQDKEQPITQYVKDRAVAAAEADRRQKADLKLQEIQTVIPGAVQFGGSFGQRAMTAVGEPGLAQAFDPKMQGKGDLAQQALDNKLTASLASADAKEHEAAAKEFYYLSTIAHQQGNTERQNQLAQIRENALVLGQQQLQERQHEFDVSPSQKITEARLKSYDDQIKTVYGEISRLQDVTGAGAPEDDSRWKFLTSELKELKANRDKEWTSAVNMGASSRGAPGGDTPPPSRYGGAPATVPTATPTGTDSDIGINTPSGFKSREDVIKQINAAGIYDPAQIDQILRGMGFGASGTPVPGAAPTGKPLKKNLFK